VPHEIEGISGNKGAALESSSVLPVEGESAMFRSEGGADNGFASQEVHGGVLSMGNSDLDLSLGEEMSSAELRRAMEEIGEEEEMSKVDGMGVPGMEQLAVIPEASPELSSTRRSKRKAGEVDEFVGLTDERHKSIRNEGTSSEPDSVLHVHDADIISNFHSIGVSLGQAWIVLKCLCQTLKIWLQSMVLLMVLLIKSLRC
jgi:hypothetical protein